MGSGLKEHRISLNCVFIYHYSNKKHNKKWSWWCFLRALTSQTRVHGALQWGIKVQQLGVLISRKQHLECERSLELSSCLGPTAALVSSVIIPTVFVQPSWHMFHNFSPFCFNLPNSLRCGYSRWLHLLIQLAFFDPPPHPKLPPSLRAIVALALLSSVMTLAPNLWLL